MKRIMDYVMSYFCKLFPGGGGGGGRGDGTLIFSYIGRHG